MPWLSAADMGRNIAAAAGASGGRRGRQRLGGAQQHPVARSGRRGQAGVAPGATPLSNMAM
jgi:hypothetical protein